MKEITILGSTGSIGTQALEVIATNPDTLHVRVLAARHNAELMAQQIRRFQPDFAVLTDKEAAHKLQQQLGTACDI